MRCNRVNKNWRWHFILFFLLFFSISSYTPAKEIINIPHSRHNLNAIRATLPGAIKVKGRLEIVPQGKENRLVLHAKDGTMYLLTGGLTDKLHHILDKLGGKNIVAVMGSKNGRTHISCDISYKFNEKNQQTQEAKCIRYYELEAYKILKSEVSEIKLAPPLRDKKAEKKALRTSLRNVPGFNPMPILTKKTLGEIEGEITAVSINTPSKTIKVNSSSNNKPVTSIITLTSETLVVYKKGDKNPVILKLSSLKRKQKVNVIYSRDNFKTKALFITITGE